MLLFPEAALALNETGAAVVRLCDGHRSTCQIIDQLEKDYLTVGRDTLAAEVEEFLNRLRVRGLLI
jgi:pyrroloquinoline quinone biosynthesis protein D